MKTRLLLAAGVMAVAASLGGPSVAVAQDQNLTINDIAVPADELEAVTMKCEELLIAGRATALAQPTAKAPAADAPAAGASENAAVTESPAEAPVAGADADAATAVAEAPAGGNMAADPAAPDKAAPVIDLATLTADLCEAGGFEAEMD